MPVLYPGAFHTMNKPGAATFEDEPGYELDVLVSQLGELAEAVQTKLGLGTSAPGATAAVLRRTAAGASAWGQVVVGDIANNALSQFQNATPTTSSPTTTAPASTVVAMPQMSVSLTLAGGGVLVVLYEAILQCNTLAQVSVLDLYVNGGQVSRREIGCKVANAADHVGGFYVVAGSTGSVMTIELRWGVTGGTLLSPLNERALTILEVKR